MIESHQNAKFKTWLSLLEARGIKKHQLVLLSGAKLVNEFLRERPERAVELLSSAKLPQLVPPVPVYALASPLFRELDIFGTGYPLLVAHAPELEDFQTAPPKGLELVVALSDPGNLGALLRSAEAFGASRVILCREACSPFLPKALRAACGATFRLKLAASAMPLAEFNLPSAYGLALQGDPLTRFQWPRNLYLILGAEGLGLPKQLVYKALTIPTTGQGESLNATVAAAIALFSYHSSRV